MIGALLPPLPKYTNILDFIAIYNRAKAYISGVTHLDLEGSENAPNISHKQLIFNTLGLFLSGIFCNLVADNQ